jgi:hypothetical protein
VKTKFRSRVQIVKDDNNEIINRGDSIYQFALFIKLKNLNFYIITNTYIKIDVDVDELNIILNINKHKCIDENVEIDLEFNKDDVEHDDEENKKKDSD